MLNSISDVAAKPESLQKAPSGVSGLDEITDGGLPAGRPTLVCGGAGCGKTLLALAFLVLIGVNLLAEGFHQHIERGYTYFAMAFAVAVEMLNLRVRGRMLEKAEAQPPANS